jgi:hypothetical protein
MDKMYRFESFCSRDRGVSGLQAGVSAALATALWQGFEPQILKLRHNF